MTTPIFEGFSISHAAILNGTTGLDEATWGDIYGVSDGSLDVDTDSFDNTGDDAILSTWQWFNSATVAVTAGYIPFPTIAALAGTTVTSSGVAPNDTYSVPLWNKASLNTPYRPMRLRIPSKDSDGVIRNMDFILYKVQFEPFSFDGPSYKDGLKLNYSGRALISTKDEKGVTLADPAIGRIVNLPG